MENRRDYCYNAYFQDRAPEHRLYNSGFDSQRNEKTGNLPYPLFPGNGINNSPINLNAFFKELKE